MEYIAKFRKGILSISGNTIRLNADFEASGDPQYALPVVLGAEENAIPIEYVDSLAFLGPYITNTTVRDYEDVLTQNRFTLKPDKNAVLLPVNVVSTASADYDYITVYIKNHHNIRHTFSKKELDHIVQSDRGTVLLCETMIKEHVTQDNVIVMDARKRGGGIVDSLSYEDMVSIDPGAANFWDIGELDGIPYQKNGALIIKLPESVREKFSDEEINGIVEKYVALGIQYIIEYYKEEIVQAPQEDSSQVVKIGQMKIGTFIIGQKI
jgi:hypothetical protein